MVKETRHIFDVSDIKAIRLQCGHCGGEVMYPPDKITVPKMCPLCNDDWVQGGLLGDHGPARRLIEALRTLLAQDAPLVRVRIETACEGEDHERQKASKG